MAGAKRKTQTQQSNGGDSNWQQKSMAVTGGYGNRRQRQAVSGAVALAAAVVTGGYGGDGWLWRRKNEQRAATAEPSDCVFFVLIAATSPCQ